MVAEKLPCTFVYTTEKLPTTDWDDSDSYEELSESFEPVKDTDAGLSDSFTSITIS